MSDPAESFPEDWHAVAVTAMAAIRATGRASLVRMVEGSFGRRAETGGGGKVGAAGGTGGGLDAGPGLRRRGRRTGGREVRAPR